ncbi:MAG: TolC family protein [Opitutaceae bacterium]|nr:TolC family protein [Verrucomicrobiales bacterium]
MKLPFLILLTAAMPVRAIDAPRFQAGTNATTITPALLGQWAEEARAGHPVLRGANARASAARANIESVRTWDDPTFRFGGTVASSRGANLREDGDLIYGLEQKLPLFGKADSQRHFADAAQATAHTQADLAFQQLRRDIALAAFRLALAEEQLALGAEDLAALETLATLTEQRYRAGNATQVDVLRAQAERAKRADQLRTDMSRRDHSRLTLNRLLNRELHAALPSLRLPEIAPPIPYSSRLVDLALRFEPRVKMLRQEIKQAEAAIQVSKRQRLPDVSVGVEGRQYSGDGGFREGTFLVSFSLPWGNRKRYDADVRREQGRLQAATFDAADYELSVREEIHHLAVEMDSGRREAVLNRDEQIPRAELALKSAMAAWESNQGMFRDVLETRRMLIDARLMQIRAITDQYLAMSELVLCCGLSDLEALQMFVKDNPVRQEGDE